MTEGLSSPSPEKPSATPPVSGAPITPDASLVPPKEKRSLREAITFERVIGVVQTLALIVGIWVAVYQSNKLKEAIDTSTWSSLAAQLTEVDKQFIEHPEMVPYFYEGKGVQKGDVDYQKAYSLAVLVIDFMDSSKVMGRHIAPDIFEPAAWERFYEYQFKASPIICSVILEEAAIYGAAIVEEGKEHCPKAVPIANPPNPVVRPPSPSPPNP